MENLLYEKIQIAKKQKVVFNQLTSFFKLSTGNHDVLSYFAAPSEVSFIDYEQIPLSSFSEAILITIPSKSEQLYIELLEVPLSFYNYKVITSDGEKLSSNKNIKHYRGIIRDDPNSLVAISFLEKEIMGVITTSTGNFNLVLDNKLGKHIFYADKNLKHKLSFNCDTIDDGLSNYDKSVLLQKSKSAILSENLCVRLYFETEYDIFQTRGSVGAVESFISGIFNQVATLYQNENIETRISEIFVWNTPDPYTATTTSGLLTQFQSNRTVFTGDLGHLLTFRTEIGGGKAAGFDGLCNPSTSGQLAVSMIQNNFSNVPIYSWTVYVLTHEFGHLFGSRHTHACVWNGNNTAIDGCAGGTEGGCPVPSIPSAGGTIMSYCHLQSVGINFNLGFGPQPGNVIRNSVANASCLCECVDSVITGPSYVCTSGTYTLINLPTGATVIWTATGKISISGANNVNPVSVTKTSDGIGTLTATITTACGSSEVVKNDIQVGLPVSPSFSFYPTTNCASENVNITLNIPAGTSITSITGKVGTVQVPLSHIGGNTYTLPPNVFQISYTLQNNCSSKSFTKLIARANC